LTRMNPRIEHSFQLTKFTAIILAAGLSSRMNAFKPLMLLGEMTILERVIRLFQSAGIEDIRVVAGYRAEDVLAVLNPLGIRSVINERYEQGMFSSVAAGVKSIEADPEAFFILPADIPLVRPQTIRTLMQAWEKSETFGLIYPTFEGKRGHPPLISSVYAGDIEQWHGEGGLSAFLAQHESYSRDAAVADENILSDLDTQADYRKLLEKYKQYDIPTVRECMALMTDIFAVEKPIQDHCRTVAAVAEKLATALNRAGNPINLGLLAAAALLHDLARNQPDHAKAGEFILKEMGFPAVADIVGAHTDITLDEDRAVQASEILYLADKSVQGERIVSITERFAKRITRHAHDPEIRERIALRLKNAVRIKERIETVTGKPLETILESSD